MTQLKVTSEVGNPCRLKAPAGIKVTDDQNRVITVIPAKNGTWAFDTQAGMTYRVRPVE